MKQQKEVLTLEEVATRLRVSKLVAWKLIRAGDIKSFRAGKAYRVLASNLDLFTKGSRSRRAER
ncbi:MAG: helix-turn-helix domain-containing protein [Candidatus Aminicenantes bacterium]|nr:helix-turn-helix domain-containing protein [Candidatus Aminicenantes bacterium]